MKRQGIDERERERKRVWLVCVCANKHWKIPILEITRCWTDDEHKHNILLYELFLSMANEMKNLFFELNAEID